MTQNFENKVARADKHSSQNFKNQSILSQNLKNKVARAD
jgi:hypothetical protein